MSENDATRSITTKVDGLELFMERIYDAPRELVFQMFSDSEFLESWWGPIGWETENRQFEFKPNGVWRYCMTCTDESQEEFFGDESWGKAVFQDIIEPEKIVYRDTFTDEEGNIDEEMPEILVTMNFIEINGQTKLTARSKFDSTETLELVMETGIEEGFASQSIRLDYLLEELKKIG